MKKQLKLEIQKIKNRNKLKEIQFKKELGERSKSSHTWRLNYKVPKGEQTKWKQIRGTEEKQKNQQENIYEKEKKSQKESEMEDGQRRNNPHIIRVSEEENKNNITGLIFKTITYENIINRKIWT